MLRKCYLDLSQSLWGVCFEGLSSRMTIFGSKNGINGDWSPFGGDLEFLSFILSTSFFRWSADLLYGRSFIARGDVHGRMNRGPGWGLCARLYSSTPPDGKLRTKLRNRKPHRFSITMPAPIEEHVRNFTEETLAAESWIERPNGFFLEKTPPTTEAQKEEKPRNKRSTPNRPTPAKLSWKRIFALQYLFEGDFWN